MGKVLRLQLQTSIQTKQEYPLHNYVLTSTSIYLSIYLFIYFLIFFFFFNYDSI